ncbi:MAG TPA: hypothetical protein VMQ58_00850 [Candidatus Saccharimonadales bacterium]|jgi:hypothetical protein|nr:hypothetical protein [Candidatus Saccharimonadales bacterium]
MNHNQDPKIKSPETSVSGLTQTVTDTLDRYAEHGLKVHGDNRMIDTTDPYTYLGEVTNPDTTMTLTFYVPSEGATSNLDLDEYTWESNGDYVVMNGPGEQGLHGGRWLTSPEDLATVSQRLSEAIAMLPAIS